MKNYYTFKNLKLVTIGFILFVFGTNQLFSQDVGYVHTATTANTESNRTYLDHPDLNGDPSARFLFAQQYDGTENPNPTGIWYNSSNSRWAVYNENSLPMPVGIKFNMYIPDDSPVQVHIADASNTAGHQSTLTGYAEATYLFLNTYYNPNFIYNPHNYGTWFNGVNRIIYEESINPITSGAAFFVMEGYGDSATFISLTSNSSNINNGVVTIDHPLLNENPDAVFLYSHYWGYPVGGNSTYLPYLTEVYYSTTVNKWRIYAYGATDFPENVWIDILVPDTILGVEDVTDKMDKITLYPNPASSVVNFSSKAEIKEIEIYDVTGKLLLNSKNAGTNLQIDVSSLAKGIYLAKIKTDKGWDSQKLIKK